MLRRLLIMLLAASSAILPGCGTPALPEASAMSHAVIPAVFSPTRGAPGQEGSTARDLLYVSGGSGVDGRVFVYTYPRGTLVATLTGFTPPTGECVDRAGDVFVVTENTSESAGVIYEYAHGGTEPIATLNDPNYAFGCSVDPTTGNLAVSGEGVAIYKNATGSPTVYSSSEFGFLYCGYDDAGNLYLTASKSNSGTERFLVRLAIGSGSFEAISFGKKLYADTFFEPSTQWDGTRMTVSTIPEYLNGREQGPEYVYRLNISGSVAKIAGVTRLSSKKSAPAGQNWIQGERIAAAYYYRSFGHVGVWPYPRGGAPRRRISHILARGEIWGVAVSPGTGSSTALAR